MLAIAACAGGSQQKPPQKSPAATKTPQQQMRALADAMCVCRTLKCLRETRMAALRLPATESVKVQVSELEACEKAARTKAATGTVRELTALAAKICDCKHAECRTKAADELVKNAEDVDAALRSAAVNDQAKLWDEFDATAKRCAPNDERLTPVAPAKMQGFAAQVCKCKDQACSDRVNKDMQNWIKAYFKGGKKKAARRHVEMWKNAQKRFERCRRQITQRGQ